MFVVQKSNHKKKISRSRRLRILFDCHPHMYSLPLLREWSFGVSDQAVQRSSPKSMQAESCNPAQVESLVKLRLGNLVWSFHIIHSCHFFCHCLVLMLQPTCHLQSVTSSMFFPNRKQQGNTTDPGLIYHRFHFQSTVLWNLVLNKGLDQTVADPKELSWPPNLVGFWNANSSCRVCYYCWGWKRAKKLNPSGIGPYVMSSSWSVMSDCEDWFRNTKGS